MTQFTIIQSFSEIRSHGQKQEGYVSLTLCELKCLKTTEWLLLTLLYFIVYFII